MATPAAARHRDLQGRLKDVEKVARRRVSTGITGPPGAPGATGSPGSTGAPGATGPSVASTAVQQQCTTNTNPTSTANLTVTGMSVTVTSPGPGAIFMVTISADVTIATAGTLNIVELMVDGVAQTGQLRTFLSGTGAACGSLPWLVTGLSAGSHTFTAQTRNSAAATSAIVNATNTRMTVLGP